MKVIIQVDGTPLGEACLRYYPGGQAPQFIPAILQITEGRAIGLLLSTKAHLMGFTPTLSTVVEVDHHRHHPIVQVGFEDRLDKGCVTPFVRAKNFKGQSGELLDAYGSPGLLRDLLINNVVHFPTPDRNLLTPYQRPDHDKRTPPKIPKSATQAPQAPDR